MAYANRTKPSVHSPKSSFLKEEDIRPEMIPPEMNLRLMINF